MTELSTQERPVRRSRLRILAAVMIACAAGLFAVGISAPLITFKTFFFFEDTQSLVTIVHTLYDEQEWALAAVVAAFSMAFPGLKLAGLAALAAGEVGGSAHGRLLGAIEVLGKWSMADVFVVALTIVAVKAAGVVEVFDHPGLYLFGTSVVLAMLAGQTLSRAMKAEAG